MDWTVQTNNDRTVDKMVLVAIQRSIDILRLMVNFEKSFSKQLRIYCACHMFVVTLWQRRFRRGKYHFQCSLSQITLFHSKFVFLCIKHISIHIWSAQWVHQRLLCLTKCLKKYSEVIVGVVWSYCNTTVRVINLTGRCKTWWLRVFCSPISPYYFSLT